MLLPPFKLLHDHSLISHDEQALAAPAPAPDADPAVKYPVYTATRVYNTLIDVEPYLTQATTVVVWTQYPAPTKAVA